MATENRVTQQNLTGQQEGQSSLFFSKEAITFLDTTFAKFLLLAELVEIAEFSGEWRRAKQIPEMIIKAINPRLKEILASLSPEASGAFMAMEGMAYALHDEDVRNEAELAATELKLLCDSVNDALQEAGIPADYRARLEALVEPLGVPNLVDFMMVIDYHEWGLDQILPRPDAGPARDLLESTFIKELTDLSPMEALSQTRAAIKGRMTRKLRPLSRHMKQYKLHQRIQLWVRNVVYGESVATIAKELDRNTDRVATEFGSEEWVKRLIREASKILEVKRPPGRPRKGGVLRHWKLMVK